MGGGRAVLAGETRVHYLRQSQKERLSNGKKQASDEKDSEVVQSSGGVGMVRVGVWIRTETTLMDVVGGVQ